MQTRLKVSLSALVALAAAAQALPVPDDVLYWAVSLRIAGTKTFADHLAAEGKKDGPARATVKKEIGLTDAEYAAVEAIAADFLAANQQRLDIRTGIFKGLNGQPPTPAQLGQLKASEAQYQATAAQQIGKLHAALGPRFSVLDNWARSAVLPHVGYSPMQKGAK